MEIALLILIIIILYIRLNTVNDKLEYLNNRFDDLKDLVKKINLQNIQPLEKQEVIQFKDLIKEVIAEPRLEPIPEKEIVELPTNEVLDVPIINAINENVIVEKPKPSITYEPAEIKKSFWEKFREQNPDMEKFVGENLISKIGVLILVLGISYFVKYAIDKNWINETARVGIGVLCGAIVMGFAHKLRGNYKAFSSVLVAGAIAIFYFTIGIAFHQYHIFSQTVAFILMVVITAFSVFISVSYDRMELAVLSLIGGFVVPFMLSTGQGNYQVLFTYITILDIGILVIAYRKRWSLVNLLAFVFTVILFGSWLGTKVVGQPNAPYLGAFLFATVFYVIFTFANIINNLPTSGIFSKLELTALISNTFLYFSAGMVIFSNFHPEMKGLFTISLALFNFVFAWVLFKKFGLDKNAVYLLIGLTLTFVTLAIPLQFEGNYITLFWAAEAVLLLWLSQKSNIVQFRFASVIVHVLMIGSLVMDWIHVYSTSTDFVPIIANTGFIAGIFATLSLFITSLLVRNETKEVSLFGITFNPIKHRNIAEIIAAIVLYLTGFLEISYQANKHFLSNFSSVSLTIAYHLLFSVVLVFLFQKSQSRAKHKFGIGLSMVNILVYMVYFANMPLGELQENLGLVSTSHVAFLLHYISLACIIYFAIIIWKDCKTKDSLSLYSQTWFIWLSAFALVYIASNEVMLHGITFLTEPVKIKNYASFALGISIYEKAKTLMIKVAFPILWGIIAFVFLSIGIKKQWRNLRIVALTLLGINIVKLFVYDISNVSETGKIIAFILLGVLILVMSFAYQKIKTIVLSNDTPEKPDHENS